MSLSSNRILIVDDDKQLVELIVIKLSQFGFLVDKAFNAEDGYRLALDGDYDVVILDVVMPRQSGLEVCQKLRTEGILTPIIILSGKTDTNTVVSGLNVGADDYLTKPFSSAELIARINAHLRRNKKTFYSQHLVKYGIVLDTVSRKASFENHSVDLTKKEAQLLRRLMSEAPKPISRQVLLQDVWGISSSHASNRLDVYIRRLRRKLIQISGANYIQTIRSRGYFFDKL